MRRRLRILIVLASTFAMVLMLNVGTAFAHPNDNDPGPAPFLRDDAVNPTGLTNAQGPTVTDNYVLPDGTVLVGLTANIGIVQGYFAHSPTCALHPGLSHN